MVSNGAGLAKRTADAVVAAGLELASLDGATVTMIRTLAADTVVATNPVDLGAAASAPAFARVLRVVVADPGVDAIVVTHAPRLGLSRETFATVIQCCADALAATTAAVVMLGERPRRSIADARGRVPVFGRVEGAARALAARLS